MELISNLLRQMTIYPEESQNSPSDKTSSETSSSQNNSSQNEKKKNKIQLKESNVNEKYFHPKLKRLLNVPDNFSFANVEIEISKFIQDIEEFLTIKTQKNKNDEKAVKQIIEEIKIDLEGEKKIELDSFFLNVSGKKVEEFFENMRQYSFPSQKIDISTNDIYTILVESAHSLKSTLKKKIEQLRKYYFFFSILDKYSEKYKKYLENFQDIFIEKYFTKSLRDVRKIDITNYKAKFTLSKNYIIIIATDHSLKLFKETMDSIKTSKSLLFIDDSTKKCFPSLYEKEKKNYKNDFNNNEIMQGKLKDKVYYNRKNSNYQRFNYLMNEINKKNNWKVRAIYFDLYHDLIVPKCVIANGLKIINEEVVSLKVEKNKLNDKIRVLNDEIVTLNDEIETLKEKSNLLEQKMDKMDKIFNFFNDPKNEYIKQLLKQMGNEEKQEEKELQKDMKDESNSQELKKKKDQSNVIKEYMLKDEILNRKEQEQKEKPNKNEKENDQKELIIKEELKVKIKVNEKENLIMIKEPKMEKGEKKEHSNDKENSKMKDALKEQENQKDDEILKERKKGIKDGE